MRRRSAAALALALLLPLPGLAGEVVVKPGETLSEIAERYGTSVQRLMQLNNLRSPQDLWAGSRIQVPGAAGSSASRGGGGSGNYTVKPGETLSEIAERYGTSVQRLMQLNGLRSPQDLWAGSRIQVPGAAPARPSGGGGGTRTTTVNANYTVKPGETLSELAERYGTSVQRLMEINNLRGPQDLWAGSRIQVPVTRTAAAPKPAVNKNATQHKVQSGETLSVIADRYGVSMQNLVALNGISDPNQVDVGRTLKLRGTPKPAAKPAAAKPAPKPQAVAAKPAAKPAPQPAAKPAAQPVAAKPVAAKPVVAQPAASPAPAAAAAPVAAKPEPKPATENSTSATATPAAAAPVATKPESKPEPKPAAKPATTTVAAKPAAKPAAAASSKPGKPASPDWRNYGPLQVDWANWQPMGGSYVAPSLNSDGQPLYLAINCNAKRLNATGQSGTWKTWDAPQSDFEHKLINDLCTAKGG